MRRLFRFLKANFQAFGRHWSVYVLLVVSINLVLTSLIVPGLTWGVNRLLVVNGIGYLTYTNFVSVLTKHPLVLISLVLLGAVDLRVSLYSNGFFIPANQTNSGTDAKHHSGSF
ncbi:glycerophosphoryl diester phosphodiesterase membrane domain-containing protein [Latilactobacillus sakei]